MDNKKSTVQDGQQKVKKLVEPVPYSQGAMSLQTDKANV